MKNTNNVAKEVFTEIYYQIQQAINTIFKGGLQNFYRVAFGQAQEKIPVFTVPFMLSLLKLTTAQYKVCNVTCTKKECEKKSKVLFIQEMLKRIKKVEQDNLFISFTFEPTEKKQCDKLIKKFIKDLEKNLVKLQTVKSDELQEVQEVQELQEVQEVQQEAIATSEEPKVFEVENLPFEETPEGIGMLKELAKDLYNHTLIDDIKKKMGLSWVEPDNKIRKLAMPYVEVKEEPKQESLYQETPENIVLLKRLASYRMDYIYRKGSLGGRRSDELIAELTKKWNMKDYEVKELSEPYFLQYEEEYKQQQEAERAEREEEKKRLEAMKLKSSNIRMLNFVVSILIKDKQKLQFSLGQLYEESDCMDFREKQIAINNCKVDLNNAQELITKILSLRNGGYVPQYYESSYDSEEDKQIATEAWTNFLAKDIYDPSNKEESIANLKLIFNKIRKF